MKIFDNDGKVNFVDENNVLVGFDSYQDCCESFGWFLDSTPHEDGEIVGDLVDEKALDGYVFDTEYFVECTSGGDEGNMAIFRLVSRYADNTTVWGKSQAAANPPVYLHLYNHHNGYYSHGFVFSKPLVIRSGSL